MTACVDGSTRIRLKLVQKCSNILLFRQNCKLHLLRLIGSCEQMQLCELHEQFADVGLIRKHTLI